MIIFFCSNVALKVFKTNKRSKRLITLRRSQWARPEQETWCSQIQKCQARKQTLNTVCVEWLVKITILRREPSNGITARRRRIWVAVFPFHVFGRYRAPFSTKLDYCSLPPPPSFYDLFGEEKKKFCCERQNCVWSRNDGEKVSSAKMENRPRTYFHIFPSSCLVLNESGKLTLEPKTPDEPKYWESHLRRSLNKGQWKGRYCGLKKRGAKACLEQNEDQRGYDMTSPSPHPQKITSLLREGRCICIN